MAPPVREAIKNLPPREGSAPVERSHDVRNGLAFESFLELHPWYSGRELVIAHVEYFPDLLSPELRVALDADGREQTKFRDVINIPGVSPTLKSNAMRQGRFWSHPLCPPVVARDGTIEVDGRRYHVP